ncbi:hypothetical protein [Candidatus Paracaedibacter symbiosus]|uniref:hypothetical protein n=1 Tax=Candidatus Paracaedibacter symbiosus TaxID=244582 RepID=UPI000509E080|nr:hypothetical protein [Candidatus Paracaedibacter symbiosus]
MRKNLLNILLAGSVLTGSTFAAEQQDILNYLAGKNPHAQMAMSDRGFGNRLWDNAKQRLTEFKDSSVFCYEAGKKCFTHGDVGTVITELFEASMKSTSEQFFKKYFHGKQDSSEFNVEALRPLVENVQNIFCTAIEGLIMKQPLYAYDHRTGTKLKIYEDKSVFKKLLGALVPDAVPLKGVMLSLADASPIRNYVVRKIDELTIEYILKCYKLCTGKTVKGSITDILNSWKQSTPREKTSTSENVAATAANSVISTGVQSPQALEFKESPAVQQETNDQISEPLFPSSILMEETNESLSNSFIFEDVNEEVLEKELSSIWTYLEPRVTHMLRNAVTEIMLPMFNKALEELTLELQRKVVPQGNTVGTILTTAGITGSTLLFGPNALLIAPFTAVGGYYATIFGTQVITKTLVDYAEEHKELYTKYYLDSFLSESKGEHYLYGLNAMPIEAEKDIFLRDYYHKAIQHEEGLARAVLNDLSKVSYIGALIKGVLASAQPSPPVIAEQTNDDYASFLLGRILAKLEVGKTLTSEDTLLLQNLQKYPSYAIKQSVSEVVKQWKESKKTNFSTYSKEQKEQQEKAEKNLINTYRLYHHEIPADIAGAYQFAGSSGWEEQFELDYIIVEKAVQNNFASHLKTFSHKDLDILKRATKDFHFLSGFFQTYLDKKATEEEVKQFLESREFLEAMIVQYIKHFGSTYVPKNKEEFQALKDSSLGFGLSDIELIELHRHMSQRDIEEHLEQSDLKIQAKEQELAIIKKQVEAIVTENKSNILRHYATQLTKELNLDEVVRWAYENAKGNLPNFKKMAENSILDESQHNSLPGYNPEQKKLAMVQAEWLKDRALLNLPIGQNFRNQLKGFLGSQERTLVYSIIMTNGFYPYLLAKNIHFNSLNYSTDEFVMLNRIGGNEKADITVPTPIIIPGGDKGDIEVTAYDLDCYASIPTTKSEQGIFNKVYLAGILNMVHKGERIKNIFAMTDEEINLIHQAIIDFKKKTLSEAEVLEFVENEHALQELMISQMPQLAKDHDLFYSFTPLYEKLIKEKKQAVAKITKQQAKK